MKKSECYHCQQSAFTRRDFLRAGTLTFLGMNISDFLRARSAQAFAQTGSDAPPAKAQAVILLWLEGGISQVDSWDVKGNTRFRPIATNVPGIQICEIFPRIAKRMDALSIIRSMKTDERNHPQSAIQVFTGHRPNPTLKAPSFGSIVSKELGSRNSMPPFVVVPRPFEDDPLLFEPCYQATSSGLNTTEWCFPIPASPISECPISAFRKRCRRKWSRTGVPC
jgi:hypothetical protein